MGSVPWESDGPGFNLPLTGHYPTCTGSKITPAGWAVMRATEADWQSRYLGRGVGSVSGFEACGFLVLSPAWPVRRYPGCCGVKRAAGIAGWVSY